MARSKHTVMHQTTDKKAQFGRIDGHLHGQTHVQYIQYIRTVHVYVHADEKLPRNTFTVNVKYSKLVFFHTSKIFAIM